ncbi:MAG TPA: UvrD-helicase domain-containing protein [Acidobacteriaceae bacterium]|nr:UvrD-helicase domain-containing protein [Acidobacteriaceae bacterium]
MTEVHVVPADSAQRDAALNIGRSVIVQAPAGSGKTDLLTRRYLKLLAVVDEPEEILAITFTRAATAEMRVRILDDLEAAARGRAIPADRIPRIELAHGALAQSARRGWNLLQQPQRLVIETIDSLSLRIAHDLPLLAHLGGNLQPTEQAAPLYALAARRTLEQLGGSDAELDRALAHFLDLRDNRLADCEDLLAGMLATRDRWAHVLPLAHHAMTEDDWDEARRRLEEPFRREVRRVVGEAHRLIDAEPTLRDELLRLAQYACENGNDDVAVLAGAHVLSPSMPLPHWKCFCDFLTRDGEWRKLVDKRHGFPPGAAGSIAKQRKDAMLWWLARLRQMPELLDALCAVRALPPETYSAAQWTTLRRVLTLLRRAIAELGVAFAESNSVDFTEISLSALQVLKNAPDRAVGNVRHLLIDEFQDTSRQQHELVAQLLGAWESAAEPGDPRTVFLVGDPMQSIYMFRQAEVELFRHVRDHGLGAEGHCVRCDPVQLSVNFRSHAGLTDPLNIYFDAIAAQPAPPGSAVVNFVPASSSQEAPRENLLHIHPQVVGDGSGRPSRDECKEAREEEARDVLRVLERHLPRIERARAAGEEYRVAVLVRARPHLAKLIPLLRQNRIPFRAVEIERLTDRQELLDLRSLTRALLHPMDRVAWLSVLRAPWCGLTLGDLHRLTGSDDRASRDLTVLELIDSNAHLLSAEGQQRLARTAGILRRAIDLRWRASESPSFASWIERTWRTLGGGACIDAAAHENAQVYFSLLDEIVPDGRAALTPTFDAELESLYAQPDPSVSDRCGIHLLTIFKAKGLGFDVVIVPGLERAPTKDDKPLIISLERQSPFDSSTEEFLVAPLGLRGDEKDPLYEWVTQQRKLRFDEERKRLFYVACTRARQELHLFGTATLSATGLAPGSKNSLLATAWPAIHADFEALAQAPPEVAVLTNLVAFPAPAGSGAEAEGELVDLAAAAEALSDAGPRRLPLEFEPEPSAQNVTAAGSLMTGSADSPEFRRPEGSRLARIIGSVVHALLQRLGSQLGQLTPDEVRARSAALLRASALTGEALASATVTVTNLLLACAADPVCQWILAPHPEAQSEAAWSGFAPESAAGSRLRTLRADRVFRAGPLPLAAGNDCLWVIDYKTSSADAGDPAAYLAAQRAVYAPQLLAYARVLRSLHGTETPLRLGLYYPALAALDWWNPALD